MEISVWRMNKRRDTATMRDEGLKLLQIRRDCVIHPSSGCFRRITPAPEAWSEIISGDCVIHLSVGCFRRTLRACRELLEVGGRTDTMVGHELFIVQQVGYCHGIPVFDLRTEHFIGRI